MKYIKNGESDIIYILDSAKSITRNGHTSCIDYGNGNIVTLQIEFNHIISFINSDQKVFDMYGYIGNEEWYVNYGLYEQRKP